MNIRFFSLIIALFSLGLSAQTAQSVLDKTAAALSGGAATATFAAKGSMGSSGGSLTAQGNKFVLTSPQVRIWFDGKTEWAWAQGSNEVNVTRPTTAEIAAINPINFINLYKRGYDATLSSKGDKHEVRLVAQNAKAAIKELYVTIDKNNNMPSSVRVRTGASNWTNITIKSVRIEKKKSDAFFRFNAKKHPNVEIIDMR